MLWFVLFVIWPLAELYVILQVAAAIGAIWMLVALVISWPVGTRILRRQGRAAWRAFVVASREGRIPTQEAANGALVLIGGILLMVPGFISDALGLLLLLPPSRRLARAVVMRHAAGDWIANAARRHGRRGARWTSGPFAREERSGRFGANRRAPDYDAEASATDLDSPELKR